MSNSNGVPSLKDKWEVSEIVYVSIMGFVMTAAVLEWILWLAAFLYCLVKVFQKAEKWHIRVLAVIIMILFTALRCIFLPIMVVTLPLPSRITQHFPKEMVEFLQWFAFWAFAILLTIPWLFCVYQLITNTVGKRKRVEAILNEQTAPKVVIVMPCYNEIPEVLITAIDSIVDGDYPPTCQHIFLSFDGAEENELYLKTIHSLGVPEISESYPVSLDVTYRGMRITVSRFPHGGKRHTQKSTFKLIDRVYAEYLQKHDNLFILFIDSDCILDKVCIQNFVYEMELKPGSDHKMLAMTGVITSTAKKQSLITLLQDMEYIHGQLFERSVESACGAVTCLPGALTILRFSAFRKMAKYYFADKAEQCADLFDYGKCHLGEDRWLTHLFMIGAKERYQIQLCPGAFCKTEAVLSFRSLLKQRRRWFLGFITNEVCMLTDIRLWRRYPILCTVRFMQNTIRTTALLFFIMVLSLLTTTQRISQLPVGFIAVSLGLNWALMIYFSFKLKRFKAALYPLMFVVNPFFNWLYMVYGIFTAGQRTWGGPRADAGAASAEKSPQQVIAEAEARGDELQVIPETFRPAIQNKEGDRLQDHPPLMPGESVEGRFAVSDMAPGNFYHQFSNGSLGTLPGHFSRNPNAPQLPLHPDPRSSFDSITSTDTSAQSSLYPKRVESIMGPEDRKKYRMAQASQREAGGAYLTQNMYSSSDMYGNKDGGNSSQESIASIASNVGYYAPNRAGSSSSLSRPASPSSPVPSIPEPVLQRPIVSRAAHGYPHSSPLARVTMAQSSTTSGSVDGDANDNMSGVSAPAAPPPPPTDVTELGPSEDTTQPSPRPKGRNKLQKTRRS
ncbi:hypothetical protein EX30DRAFT_152079 [Ascodesmis nigricans]|uniref:chitin synthase n=1 Tax=Ascodesmis nigricans TaxID=341454 RepID=A0A4S2N2E6_9PEZI|nr:hypothetical protein EX30DRAFT_152079 [Ascodesmis nigricans]